VAIDPQSRNPKAQAALALHRFGFGPRSGDIETIASDPRGALLADIKSDAARISDLRLPTSGQAFRELRNFRREKKAERQAKQMEPAANSMADGGDNGAQMPKAGPPLPQRIFLAEAKARFDAALHAPIGFTERLVWFWSNHFCVSADKGPVRVLCGPYEREAIRPHVLGRFADMLLAVETHPAMLFYLDNVRSIGSGSLAGMRQHKGINENLAREIMELHTLGVRAGYTQTDVTSFANVISGWTIVPPKDPERGGEFVFNERMHEPGAQTLVGKTYSGIGFDQGRAVLNELAMRPATAKHIATKLAHHFVADDPPPALIERLSRRFLDTSGDLMEVSKAMVTATESWETPHGKLKRPGEWIIGALRATGFTPQDVRRVVNAQKLLGEPLWRPPAPKGFSDDSAAWIDGLASRLDIANQIARLANGQGREPDDMVEAALGPLASKDTRDAIQRAASPAQAMALLLMAPEFQKR
jgi:uncharacterized protein (DUF1800 family)